jgi:hypothetical protein
VINLYFIKRSKSEKDRAIPVEQFDIRRIDTTIMREVKVLDRKGRKVCKGMDIETFMRKFG